MIKRKFAAALVGLSVAMFGAASSAQARELVVATDTAFVPFEFKQGNTYTGFDVDLWAAIAGELKLQYKLQPMDFNGIIPGLQTRTSTWRWPASPFATTARRSSTSDPYYESGLAILVGDKNTDIKDAKSLSGKTVAVKTGTATVDFLKAQVPDAKLKLFPNIDNAYLELATGRVDAAVHDTPNVQYYANTAGKGRVKVVGSVKSGDFYGIAFPKGSDLVPQVNKALATLKANGEYDAIYTKWFGKKP